MPASELYEANHPESVRATILSRADDVFKNAAHEAQSKRHNFEFSLYSVKVSVDPRYTADDVRKVYEVNALIEKLPTALAEGDASVIGWLSAFAETSNQRIRGGRVIPYDKVAVLDLLTQHYKGTKDVPVEEFDAWNTNPTPKLVATCTIANAISELKMELPVNANHARAAKEYTQLAGEGNAAVDWFNRLGTRTGRGRV